MLRLFESHKIRNTVLMEGIWDFTVPYNEKIYKMPVPSCWEQHPDFYTYRGCATYTKEIEVTYDCNLRLIFKGISHTADIYFDNEFIMHHYNAYTPFEGVVRKVKRGKHIIRVEVDNSFNEKSALHIPNDYYTFGGIIRSCAYEVIGDCYIKNVKFTPLYENGEWYGRIEAQVENLSNTEKTVDLTVSVCEKTTTFNNIKLTHGKKVTLQKTERYTNVLEWSNETPNLYYINSVLWENGKTVDDLIDRTGFRMVGVCNKKITINGNKVFLKGFNRHEYHGSTGCSLPLNMMVKDIESMIELGCNAIRFSHYPNDELFIDLCDQYGLMVWEENHARGLSIEDMMNPNFEQQCKDCINEMVDNHSNHPSIIIWGILNECASQITEGRKMYIKQYKQIKAMDKSRLTASATCHHFKDLCLDLPDIPSLNIYSEWYENQSVKEAFDREIEWMRSSGADNKPIIISEFGAAAIYGYRDPAHSKWSEERQAEIIDHCLNAYMPSSEIAGVFIWQFADCRVTEDGGWFSTRARCHNNKGVYDEYRRPKLAAEVVKKHYETAADI